MRGEGGGRERLPRYGREISVSCLYLFICLFSDVAVNSLPRFVSGSLL